MHKPDIYEFHAHIDTETDYLTILVKYSAYEDPGCVSGPADNWREPYAEMEILEALLLPDGVPFNGTDAQAAELVEQAWDDFYQYQQRITWAHV